MASRLFHPRMMAALEPNFFAQICTIQSSTEAQDAAGQPQDNWADAPGLVGLACRVGGISGGERRTVSQKYLDATHQILISGHYSAILEKQRAVVDGQAYDILLPVPSPEQAVTKLVVRLVR